MTSIAARAVAIALNRPEVAPSVATSLFDGLWGLWTVGGQEHVANIVLTFVIIYMF